MVWFSSVCLFLMNMHEALYYAHLRLNTEQFSLFNIMENCEERQEKTFSEGIVIAVENSTVLHPTSVGFSPVCAV